MDLPTQVSDRVMERSFAFKTLVIIVGALLLLLSSFMRPHYPYIWAIPFLTGALVEWLIVATVYRELNQIENSINQTQNEIETTKEEIETIQSEIEQTRDNAFRASGSSSHRGRDLESRLEKVEDEIGMYRVGRGGLKRRVTALENKLR